ncbi:hypothetical protein F4680DRAFT_412924 [Xylaria scruposa]|nr:hypothetical protein F4680DRAFT_412924 [Xylaria scruposa]
MSARSRLGQFISRAATVLSFFFCSFFSSLSAQVHSFTTWSYVIHLLITVNSKQSHLLQLTGTTRLIQHLPLRQHKYNEVRTSPHSYSFRGRRNRRPAKYQSWRLFPCIGGW